MPSKNSPVNVLLLATKIYTYFLVLFHFSVADIFRNDQKLNLCPSGKVSSFEDNTICVTPLNGICEDNPATKSTSNKCGPGSECFNSTCRCVKGHTAYDDNSGCKLSINPSEVTTINVISKGIVSPTPKETLPSPTTSNSTKNEDQSGKKTTRKEYYVVAPTTIDATITLKSTVPTTLTYNDTNSVVFAHLISRTGSAYGSQSGYHKGSYYNSTNRNNTAVSPYRVNLENAVVCFIMSSIAFNPLHL